MKAKRSTAAVTKYAIYLEGIGIFLGADEGVLTLFDNQRDAFRWAADNYEFDTYTEAHRKGWVTVVPFSIREIPRTRRKQK